MKEIELGPIMESDALVLQAIIKAIVPKVVVEFGHLQGFSSRKILEALPVNSALYSYDITMPQTMIGDGRFHFKQQDMTTIELEIDFKIDMVFFDAGHDLEQNKITFTKIVPNLLDRAVIVIHDTGCWNTALFDNPWFGKMVGENQKAHQPAEREFCNWLSSKGYNVVHLHSMNEVRHGISIAQFKKDLVI